MRKYISSQDYDFAKLCKQSIQEDKPDVWVDPIIPQRYDVIPEALTAWQYNYLKIDDFIEKAVVEAKKNNRRVRLYIQDTSDVWNHDDLKDYFNTVLSRNYTSSPSGEVHGHSHMVGGQFVGGNAQDVKIGLIRRFVEEGLVEIVLQKVLGDTGSGSFTRITNSHQDVVSDVFEGAKFVNMSYGGPSSYAPLSELMKTGKEQHNIFYFASIGNSGYREGEDRTGFPGNDPSTIGCASIDSSGNRSYFSAVDDSRIAMFMAAPGSAVTTTLKDNTYGTVNGTSFSGPNSCAMGIIQYLLNPSIKNQADLEAEFIKDLTDHGLPERDRFLGHGVPIMTNNFFSSTPTPPPPIPVPTPPKLTFPIDNEILDTEEVKFIWEPATYAISYTIQVIDHLGRIQLERTTTGTSYPYKLLYGTYRWRVKSLGISGNSEYSSFENFKIQEQQEPVLSPPQLLLPTNEQVLDNVEVSFAWIKVDEANSYYIQISSNKNFTNLVIDEMITSNEVKYLLEEKEYYWRVKAVSDFTSSEYSEVRSFSIEKEEPVMPQKKTPFTINKVFESRYKKQGDSEFKTLLFTVDIEYVHTDRVEDIYTIIRDRLDSHYKRTYLYFGSEPDEHLAAYNIARFTKLLLKDIEVVKISTVNDTGVGVLLQNEDLKKISRQDSDVQIKYLW